jgi:hypothetical protein
MFGFTQEQIAQFGSKLLMVAGGFAGGYLLAMVAGIGYDKMLAHKESPAFLHRWLRRIGGVLGALIVAFLVFRGGGFGNGNGTGSGGDTPNTGTQTGTGGTDPGTMTTPKTKSSDTPVTLKPLDVRILAGEEVEKNSEKFYIIGEASVAVDRGSLLANVTDLQRSNSNATVVVVYRFGRDAGTKTIGFTDLETDLKQLKVQFLAEDEFKALIRKTP